MKNIEMLLSFELVKENSILDYYNDKKIENQVGMKYYLYKSVRQFNIIFAKIETLKQIFYHPNGFRIVSFAPPEEKIDKISNYNGSLNK